MTQVSIPKRQVLAGALCAATLCAPAFAQDWALPDSFEE